ncbi:hypothetical protein GWD52_00520 [Enterobacteriaceae bacterium 4M9]|nr:hypothetical protein [Enterobacteriaceae bacterium 4M9]
MRFSLLTLLVLMLAGCAAGYDEYGDTANRQPVNVDVQNLYSLDANGELRRNTQLQQMPSQESHSMGGGARFGW